MKTACGLDTISETCVVFNGEPNFMHMTNLFHF